MLAKIVEHVTTERDETVKTLLVHNHPVFAQLADAAQIPIRVLFLDKDELEHLMLAFDYSEDLFVGPSGLFYSRIGPSEKHQVHVLDEIFDKEGRLKPVEPGDWNRTFVTCTVEEDDDIPF
jgi:hypothetical protein